MEEGEQRMKDGGRRRKGDKRISERRGTSEMWDNEGKGKKDGVFQQDRDFKPTRCNLV